MVKAMVDLQGGDLTGSAQLIFAALTGQASYSAGSRHPGWAIRAPDFPFEIRSPE
jgi:hypothetical protein